MSEVTRLVIVLSIIGFGVIVALIWSLAETNRARLTGLKCLQRWAMSAALMALAFTFFGAMAVGVRVFSMLLMIGGTALGTLTGLLAIGWALAAHYQYIFNEYADFQHFWAAVRAEPDKRRKMRCYWGSELPSGFVKEPGPTHVDRKAGIALGVGLTVAAVLLGLVARFGSIHPVALHARIALDLLLLIYGTVVLVTALRLKDNNLRA